MKIIILSFLILGLIITLSLIKTLKNKSKSSNNNKNLKYSQKTKENFKEIQLSHGSPSICINKEKGFSQWNNKKHIFKDIILRDQDENNIYTICKIKLSVFDLNKLKINDLNNNIDYDHYKQELHIKGNSINENTKILSHILEIVLFDLGENKEERKNKDLRENKEERKNKDKQNNKDFGENKNEQKNKDCEMFYNRNDHF